MLPTRILLALVALISTARGDWLLSDYSFAATDSAAVQAGYGIVGFHNPSSVVKTEVSGGAVRLTASKISSEGNEGYSARISLRHFLTPDGGTHDLTGLKSVDFEFKNSKTITDVMTISFGSDAYSGDKEKAGTVFEAGISGAADKAASTVWKQASVSVADFATPKWWTDIPADFPTIDGVLKEVRNIQFEPKTAYEDGGTQDGTACTKCTNPTMDSLTLEIRNIVLVGVQKYPFPNRAGIGCTGTPVILDGGFDDNMNEAGGYWSDVSDADSTWTKMPLSNGSSTSSYELMGGDEFVSGHITLRASLNKMVAGQWHRDAGWARIRTGFEGAGYMIGTGLTGIQFRIQADTLSSVVEAIRFKVPLMGISDSATHSVLIPAGNIITQSGDVVCIRPEDLTQGENVQKSQRSIFDATRGIKALEWEAQITDKRNPAISRAEVKLSIADVRLYGVIDYGKIWVVQPRSPSHPFAITYANGSLNLRGLTGIATVDIFSLDGHRMASFAPTSRIPLRLARGTWILAAHRRDGMVATQPFVVAGP